MINQIPGAESEPSNTRVLIPSDMREPYIMRGNNE